MKVIFLDFAGTIQEDGYDPRTVRQGEPNSTIQALNKITDATGAGIVISSDAVKRFRDPNESRLPEATAFLRWMGVTGDIVGETLQTHEAHSGPTTRAGEIRTWLGEHPEVEAYVILDDLPLHAMKPYQDDLWVMEEKSLTPEEAKHFIWLSPFHHLLNDEDADRAIRILG